MFYIPLVGTVIALIGWYVTAMILFVPAIPTAELSDYGLYVFRILSWATFGISFVFMIMSYLPTKMNHKKWRRSDADWRADVFVRTTAMFSLLTSLTASFLLTDTGLSDDEIDGLRLLTPLTAYETLLGALCFAPLLFVLVIYAVFGRAVGNAINPRII